MPEPTQRILRRVQGEQDGWTGSSPNTRPTTPEKRDGGQVTTHVDRGSYRNTGFLTPRPARIIVPPGIGWHLVRQAGTRAMFDSARGRGRGRAILPEREICGEAAVHNLRLRDGFASGCTG